jgi:hypothetical protein
MKSSVTDNFFKDPDSIIEIAKQQTYYKRNSDQYFEGVRTPNMKYVDSDFFNKIATDLVYNYFDKDKTYAIDGSMYFHKHRNEDLLDPHWLYDRIHQDNAVISSIVYLTPDLPMHYGTEIYREVDGKYVLDLSFNNKFNRLVQFPSILPHCAMNMPENSQDRLALLFFLEKIEEYNDNQNH